MWTCFACKDTRWRSAYNARRHEKGLAHLEHVAFLDQQSVVNTPPTSLLEERLSAIAAPLSELCRDLSTSLDPFSVDHAAPIPLLPGHVMSPTAYTLGADFLTPINEGVISSLTHSLAQWLADPLHPPLAPIPCGPMPIPEEFIPHRMSDRIIIISLSLFAHYRWFVYGRLSCPSASRLR